MEGSSAGPVLYRSKMSRVPVENRLAWQMSASPLSILRARQIEVHMKQMATVKGRPATIETAWTAPRAFWPDS